MVWYCITCIKQMKTKKKMRKRVKSGSINGKRRRKKKQPKLALKLCRHLFVHLSFCWKLRFTRNMWKMFWRWFHFSLCVSLFGCMNAMDVRAVPLRCVNVPGNVFTFRSHLLLYSFVSLISIFFWIVCTIFITVCKCTHTRIKCLTSCIHGTHSLHTH